VTMVPMGRAPHREIHPEPGPDVRLELCRMATATAPWLSVSAIEVERGGPSYTVDTLETMRRQEPADELTLILGADQAANLASWREPERVLSLARVAVAAREGIEREAVLRRLDALADDGRIRFFDMPRIDVSSTLVRERVAEGRPVEYLVPETVRMALAERALYREAARVGGG
jgi:nicotinate-nucleotide adenylyltransferase